MSEISIFLNMFFDKISIGLNMFFDKISIGEFK